MKILAIESSCDDSGIAILEDNAKDSQPGILANLISSQIKIHAKWGGVVPMLAKREHQRNLPPLLKKALRESNLLKISDKTANPRLQSLSSILEREPELLKKLLPLLKKYQKPDIGLIAVTQGPGLEPALWVGVNLAKALSSVWDIPILPVNHIEGHLTAAFAINENGGISDEKLNESVLPAICLVVSGGHTQLILIKKIGEYAIIGETRDDAAGEAFDKVAKMLGLGYPGGPIIAKLASQWEKRAGNLKTESLNQFSFPRPMINSGDFDLSFSGLKTAVLYTLQKMTKTQIKKAAPAIAAEFQKAVVDVLVQKTINSAKKHGGKSIWLSGGVAANQALRQNLERAAQKNNFSFMTPPGIYCADNAAMIALAAFYQLKQDRAKKISWQDLKAESNLRIS